jgi:hypothetical protein
VKSSPEFFNAFSKIGVVNVVPIPVCVYGGLWEKRGVERRDRYIFFLNVRSVSVSLVKFQWWKILSSIVSCFLGVVFRECAKIVHFSSLCLMSKIHFARTLLIQMCKLKVLSPLELLGRGVSSALSLVPFLLFHIALS